MTVPARHALLLLAWLALTVAGCVMGVHLALDRQRVAFEADAQAEHRWLSQQAKQQETLLETLALLQPAAAAPGAVAPEVRLPALHPSLQKVLRQDAQTPWPPGLASRLAAAQAQSAQTSRAVLAHIELTAGRYLLVRAAEPASFALQVDLRTLAADGDGQPLATHGQVRAWLEYGGQRRVLLPGAAGADDPGGWRYGFRQRLASETLPVDLVAVRRVGWSSLPWVGLATWCLATSLLALAVAARGQRSRRSAQRPGDPLTLEDLSSLSFDSLAHADRQWLPGEAQGRRFGRREEPLIVTLREIDREPPELAVARGAINQAARRSRRASEVISRLGGGPPEATGGRALEQEVPVDELLRDALELVGPECEHLRVQAKLLIEEPLGTLRADPVALEQIVHTLLSNALRAVSQLEGEERRIELSCAVLESHLHLSVRDNGHGIPQELLPRLFEPFFSARSEGLGQGLSLCATLVRSMGGTVSAAPVAPHGSLLRVVLPRTH